MLVLSTARTSPRYTRGRRPKTMGHECGCSAPKRCSNSIQPMSAPGTPTPAAGVPLCLHCGHGAALPQTAGDQHTVSMSKVITIGDRSPASYLCLASCSILSRFRSKHTMGYCWQVLLRLRRPRASRLTQQITSVGPSIIVNRIPPAKFRAGSLTAVTVCIAGSLIAAMLCWVCMARLRIC
jgi:hypothetical protein